MRHRRRNTLESLAKFRTAAAAIAVGGLLAAIGGCRNAPPTPPPQPPPATGPPAYFIADRNTRVYHRPECSHLPPTERQVRLDPNMLELTRSLHTPCEFCKPNESSAGRPPKGPMPPSPPTPAPGNQIH